ncbi:MAG: non-homologous end-joining DNA ligase [Candidatus Bathyarchaeia archaeon]
MLEERLRPMLALPSLPFDSRDHVFELKWDGTRCILYLRGREIRLRNRRLQDITYRYPEFSTLRECIRARSAIIDGEIVVLSEGRPDFLKLQSREHVVDPFRIEVLAESMSATFVAFDLLFLNERWLLDHPLLERKAKLSRILEGHELLLESRHVEEKGKSFFEKAVELGFEGIMAKEKESPYLPGKRSKYWLKIKPRSKMLCYVLGYKRAKGGKDVASLLVGSKEGAGFIFRGSVGSGLRGEHKANILSRLEELRRQSPVIDSLKRLKGIEWVEPRVLCEVEFFEVTRKGRLRGPVFKGLFR